MVVEVRGLSTTNYADLGAEADKVMQQLKSVPGLVDFNSSYTAGRPEIRFVVDRAKAAELGLSTAQIGSTIRTLVNGQVVTTYRGDDNEADIRVLLDDRNQASVDDILDLSLLTPAGKLIPLRQVAKPEEATGPGQILRVDKQPTIRISANVAGRPVPVAVAEVTALVDKMQLPDGMLAKMGGTTEAQAEGFRSLGLAMLLSVLFIYMVLASQFNSFIQPLLIMIALPLAIVGAPAGAAGHRQGPRHDGLYRLHHVDGSRDQELDFAGRFCQPRAWQGAERPRGHAPRRSHSPAPHSHDLALDDLGDDPAGVRPERRRRIPPIDVDRHHGRPGDQYAVDAADRPRGLLDGGGLAGSLERAPRRPPGSERGARGSRPAARTFTRRRRHRLPRRLSDGEEIIRSAIAPSPANRCMMDHGTIIHPVGWAKASPQLSGEPHMKLPEYITKSEVQRVCRELGIRDWTTLTTPEVTDDEARRIQAEVGGETGELTPEQFRQGLEVELEHGITFPDANVTNNHPLLTGKIVLAHLKEMLDYYDRLNVAELEGDLLKATRAGNAEKVMRLYRRLLAARAALSAKENDSL